MYNQLPRNQRRDNLKNYLYTCFWFKGYCPIDYRRTRDRLEPREIKINLVAYLMISKHNIHVNIN